MRSTAHLTRRPRSASPRWLRAAIAVLIVLGAIAALQRAAQTVWPSRRAPGETLTGFEHRSLELLAALGDVVPGTPTYQRMATDVADFGRTYETHPRNTLLHVLPGALLMLLAPLQFSKRIRNRYLSFHRWLGRCLLVLVMVIGWSAFYLGLLSPFAGTPESLTILVFGGLFVFSAGRAFLAIRKGDIERHRAWMTRMFALAIGISTARVVMMILAMIVVGRLREIFVPSLWIGWVGSLLVAEYWIRRTRSPAHSRVPPALARAQGPA